jgi:hypothetical protein
MYPPPHMTRDMHVSSPSHDTGHACILLLISRSDQEHIHIKNTYTEENILVSVCKYTPDRICIREHIYF